MQAETEGSISSFFFFFFCIDGEAATFTCPLYTSCSMPLRLPVLSALIKFGENITKRKFGAGVGEMIKRTLLEQFNQHEKLEKHIAVI